MSIFLKKMLGQFQFGLFVVVLCSSSSLAIIKDVIYGKVHPEFPSDFSDTLITTVPGKSISVIQCGAVCSSHPDCLVYCMEGDSCKLFWAAVTARWTGPVASGGSVAYKFQKCFSILGGPKEIMHNAIPSASSIYSISDAEDRAINGYFATSFNDMFGTSTSTDPWWSGELPIAYNISLIWLHARTDHANNLEIRFGLDSNIHNNPVIATTDNGFYNRQVIFPIEPPAYGRFLTIKRYGSDSYVSLGSVCVFKV